MKQKKSLTSNHVLSTLACALLLCALACAFQSTQQAHAASDAAALSAGDADVSEQYADYSHSVTKGTLTVSLLEEFGGASVSVWSDSPSTLYLNVADDTSSTVTVKSSNPSIVSVPEEYASFNPQDYYYGYTQIHCDVPAIGKATLTISNGTDAIQVPVVAYPEEAAKLTSATKASYNKVKLTWSQSPAVDGYDIKRAPLDENNYRTGDYAVIASVNGAKTTTTTVAAPWEQNYSYFVVPFIEMNGRHFSGGSLDGYALEYELPKAEVRITSAMKASPNGIKLAWKADAGAAGFEVYRSAHENDGYKKIAKTTTTSYIDGKAKRGTTYYYRIRAKYQGSGTVDSPSLGQMISKGAKAVKKQFKQGKSQGSWNLRSSRDTLYYSQGTKLYAVHYAGSALQVIGFNAKMKKVSEKTVKLPKHDLKGGLYHGPDGNNYIAVGYNNSKESKTKTVIKVIKYNSKWKKCGTAAIKGSASNSFPGIHSPFSFGTTSFDMRGSTLYLFTSRLMFKTSDGLNHQSNIGFSINTKTMKARDDNVAYTSHSFEQRVRFKDGSIYLADHGDAYSRGICLTWQDGYGSKDPASRKEVVPFPFMGETGNNFTGASMGGMEVGANNILVCGSAQPHNIGVAGIKGFGSFKENVYVTVTNRESGKSSVKWLTSINPKKGKQSVEAVRMVKLGDNRFAVMYTIADDKTGKATLYCTAINNEGKKLLTRKYSKMDFSGSQPLLMNGNIYWVEQADSGTTYLCRIPAL